MRKIAPGQFDLLHPHAPLAPAAPEDLVVHPQRDDPGAPGSPIRADGLPLSGRAAVCEKSGGGCGSTRGARLTQPRPVILYHIGVCQSATVVPRVGRRRSLVPFGPQKSTGPWVWRLPMNSDSHSNAPIAHSSKLAITDERLAITDADSGYPVAITDTCK